MNQKSNYRIKRECPSCYSQKHVEIPKYSQQGWTCVKCSDCDFIFLDETPRYEALSEEMAWSSQFAKEKKRRKDKEPFIAWLDQKTRWRLHLFRDDEWGYISSKVTSGTVLDVGCGISCNIPEQFTPYGIEIEKSSALTSGKLMEARGGHVVHAPALDGLKTFADESLDGIIMRSYLEHEANPRKVLEACHSKLKKNGVIYVKVPNFGTLNRLVRGPKWCGLRYPDHLNYFTINSMQKMGNVSGYDFSLKNIATRYTNDNLHGFLTKRAR